MAKNENTHIVEAVRKTAEYANVMKLYGIEDVSTPKNVRRGSIFFRTPAPCFGSGNKLLGYYEYSIYSSGYLRLFSPETKRYGMMGVVKCERPDIDVELVKMYVELLKILPRIYNRKMKKEGLFQEIKFLEEIPQNQIPLFMHHKWKFSYCKKLYLERLKNRIDILELAVA